MLRRLPLQIIDLPLDPQPVGLGNSCDGILDLFHRFGLDLRDVI